MPVIGTGMWDRPSPINLPATPERNPSVWSDIIKTLITAGSEIVAKKIEADKMNKMLSDLGIVKTTPATTTKPTIEDYRKAIMTANPSADVKLKEGIPPDVLNKLMRVYGAKRPMPVTTPATTEWNAERMAELGATVNLPTKQAELSPKQNLFQNLTTTPEGEPAININGTIVPIKSLSKAGFTAKPEQTYEEFLREKYKDKDTGLMNWDIVPPEDKKILKAYTTETYKRFLENKYKNPETGLVEWDKISPEDKQVMKNSFQPNFFEEPALPKNEEVIPSQKREKGKKYKNKEGEERRWLGDKWSDPL